MLSIEEHMSNDLVIKDLRVNVADKEILKGVNLTIKQGTIHAWVYRIRKQ